MIFECMTLAIAIYVCVEKNFPGVQVHFFLCQLLPNRNINAAVNIKRVGVGTFPTFFGSGSQKAENLLSLKQRETKKPTPYH